MIKKILGVVCIVIGVIFAIRFFPEFLNMIKYSFRNSSDTWDLLRNAAKDLLEYIAAPLLFIVLGFIAFDK